MELKVVTGPSKKKFSFNHLRKLKGVYHKWAEDHSEQHGERFPLYSLSELHGATPDKHKKNLYIPHRGIWYISMYENSILCDILNGIKTTDKELFNGIEVKKVQHFNASNYGVVEDGAYIFKVRGPVLLQLGVDGVKNYQKHYLYNHPNREFVDGKLTEIAKNKLEKAGLNSEGLELSFYRDLPYPTIRSALRTINKPNDKPLNKKGSICPVRVKGTKEQVQFVWNVGVGHLTGMGFGNLGEQFFNFLIKTQNNEVLRC